MPTANPLRDPSVSPPSIGEQALVRGITFWPATMLVVGNVIGSAIFLTTGAMVEALPSASLVLGAWLAGGLMACAGGLTFAEMGAMLPRSGGMYVFLEEAYGPLVAFLFGWTMVLIVLPGGTAAVAVGFAESFSYFVPSLSTTRLLTSIPLPLGALTISAGQVVAALSIAALASANLFGVAAASRVAALVTMLKVVAVVAIPIVGDRRLAAHACADAGRPTGCATACSLRRRDDCRDVGLRRVGVPGLRGRAKCTTRRARCPVRSSTGRSA